MVSQGETPLIIAVRQRDLVAVRLLLESGANANRVSRTGSSALRECVQGGSDDGAFVSVLLQHGADPDLKSANRPSVRDFVYARGPSSARDAIDHARPPPPYGHPEEVARILKVLSFKMLCDSLIPSYAQRTRAAYGAWRQSRAAAIAGVEASPDYKAYQAYDQAGLEEMRTGHDPEQQQQLAMLRTACDTQLIDEFRGVKTALTTEPTPSPAGTLLAPAGVQAPSAAPPAIIRKTAPQAQGGGMMSHPSPQ
jgi:hypothetical protein